MKKIGSYFLQGTLFAAPVVIVVYILYAIFVKVDGWLANTIAPLIGFHIPGLGIISLFVILTALGYIGQTALVRPAKKMMGNFIRKIPIFNLLYSSISDLFSAFVGKEKKFNVPVKVLFNKENNLWKLGFVTNESLTEFDLNDLAAVYFQHSYNFSGELYLVPKERIERLDIPSSEVMKFVVSGGVTRIESLKNEH